jgi:acetyl-CoA C-acetyltransferase
MKEVFEEAVIIGAARTAVGKFQGALSSFSSPELGSFAIRAAIERAGVDASEVDEVIMGCALQAGVGQNPARQAALKAGLANSVAALTINKVCGSGLKAVGLAAQAVAVGDSQLVVAGGMESMSRAPYLLPKAREGYRLGDGKLIDSMIHDGLWCAFENWHMGETAELVSDVYKVSREEQDAYAIGSQTRAIAAIDSGRFKDEIVGVSIPQRGGKSIVFDTDEGPRRETSPAMLSRLKPAFRTVGTVTAGNSSTINDGAAAVVVTSANRARAINRAPLARIVAQATSGLEPKLVMMAPVEAVRRVAAKAGWNLNDVELIELNEAFAAQAVALIKELRLDAERVNVNGGAIALGHPIGASGARILVTLLYEMARRNVRRGIASLCLGGGNAVAMAVERPQG